MRRLLLLAVAAALLMPCLALGQDWTYVPVPERPNDTRTPRLLDIASDGDVVWFSTEFHGIMAYSGAEWDTLRYGDECVGLRSDAYRYVMFVDAAGDKWTAKLGTQTLDRMNDGGTFGVNAHCDDQWTYYGSPAQLNSWNVFAMAEDQLGNKWFGIRDDNGIETSILELLVENGAGTADDDWYHFGDDFEPDIFFDDDVRDLAVDDSNRLWIVYGSNGVDVWDFGDYASFDDDEITHYGLEQGLPSNTVRSVHVASDGRVWLGTDNGLAYLTPSAESWTALEGTFDLRIYDIDSDSQGHIWAATDQGVLMVYRSTEAHYLYDTADGLMDETVILIAVDQTDGTVWAVSEDLNNTHLNVLESGFAPEPRVAVYPNPWRERTAEGFGVKVLGAPDGSRVGFFDITGQSVRELKASPEPFDWDLLDSSGSKVPSGVYVVRVETPDGQVFFTKVAVIR